MNPHELLAKATEGEWGWHYRPDDKSAPASIYAENEFIYAVAMCPQHGTQQFPNDAALIVWLRNNAEALLDLIEQADVHIRDHLAMLDSEKIDFPVTKIALKHWCAKRDDLLGVKDEKAN